MADKVFHGQPVVKNDSITHVNYGEEFDGKVYNGHPIVENGKVKYVLPGQLGADWQGNQFAYNTHISGPSPIPSPFLAMIPNSEYLAMIEGSEFFAMITEV